MRPHGHARVDSNSPRAFAVCDRCGFWYNHNNLQWQLDYRGSKLANLRILVCDKCLDDPQPQLKPRIIGPDPIPIINPRPETIVTVTTTVSDTYSMLSTDQLISCIGSGSFTITLPTVVTASSTFTWPVAVGTAGKTVTVQANGTGTITIVPLDGTIQGDVFYTLNSGEEVALFADTLNSNWETIPCLPTPVETAFSAILKEDVPSLVLAEDGTMILLQESNT